MTQPAPSLVFRSTSLDAVISDALVHLVLDGGEGSAHGSSTLVFSGEGETPAAALEHALDDIREQCAEQGCWPVAVDAERSLQTDIGTRIWGTVACDESGAAHAPMATARIDIEQEGEGWTLTITAR